MVPATSSRPRALLVAAGDWGATLRLPALLSEAGYGVTLFGPEWLTAGVSRHLERHVPAPADYPDLTAFCDRLKAHLTEGSERYGSSLVAEGSTLIALVGRSDEPWARALLPIKNPACSPQFAVAKAELVPLGRDHPEFFAESILCSTPAAAEEAGRQFGFPLVLKRSVSFAGQGVLIARTEAELADVWRRLGEGGGLVAQRFVRGELGSTSVLFWHGRPITWISSRKYRTYPDALGPSCARRFIQHPGGGACWNFWESTRDITGWPESIGSSSKARAGCR